MALDIGLAKLGLSVISLISSRGLDFSCYRAKAMDVNYRIYFIAVNNKLIRIKSSYANVLVCIQNNHLFVI